MRRRTFVPAALAFAAGVRAAPTVPRPAANLSWRLASGRELSLAQYRGKAVALSFLLTTCPHCQKCSRILQQMLREYGARGFEALGIAINEMSHILVEDYRRDHGITYPVGYLDREAACSFLQIPPELRMMMPHVVFIDRKGVIRAQYAGDDKFFLDEERSIRREIEKLLADSTAPAGKKSE